MTVPAQPTPEDQEAWLASPCPTCATPIGDHPLRLWVEHQVFDVPFENVDHAPTPVPDVPMADTVDVRAMSGTGPMGPIAVIELHFQRAKLVGPNETVTKVLFVAPANVMRHAGRLIRDASFRSAESVDGKKA